MRRDSVRPIGADSRTWSFPIDRGDARKTAKSLRSVIEGVRDGKSLMVFPEGTRTPDGHLQEFNPLLDLSHLIRDVGFAVRYE